ncbi:uncharacterized protein LOC127240574 isoform X2 [Andrographis paniculata]|uniref:uncharacterized protein LOC127240574 isoform X2 n=1 Tax=Andrographis paniculata TaxID=175694 RepID=UPI0021E6DFAB|nr:uncharacterized protein LOC127240574 isoform X2 [Andrographis paniculata]
MRRSVTELHDATCKFQSINKPCPIMYCQKCLLNRYCETAEEVASLEQWTCPECRGSFCMKKEVTNPLVFSPMKQKLEDFPLYLKCYLERRPATKFAAKKSFFELHA